MGEKDDPTASNFIGYMVENWEQARWVYEQLEAHGYRTILAGRDFSAGDNIRLMIQHALKTSARMIAILSPAYLASRYPGRMGGSLPS